MIPGAKDKLKLGDWNCLCMVCGFKFKASELRRRWDGIICCPADYEQRHPQDLLKGRPDNPSVPYSVPNDIQYITVAPVDGSTL